MLGGQGAEMAAVVHPFALAAIALVATGCVADEFDSPYARYGAVAELKESCGTAGLLAAPDAMKLGVGIRLVSGRAVHWDHGEGIMMGTLDNLGSFSVSRFLRVDMREGDAEAPSCYVERDMIIDGVLLGNPDSAGTYDEFEGAMRYVYRAYGGSDCSDLLEGPEAIADELPCTVSYDLEGVRN